MELEKQNKQLKESQTLEGINIAMGTSKSLFGDGLPREPERYTL